MPDPRFRIDPLAHLPGTVELIGIGRACRPYGTAKEVELEVLLAGGADDRVLGVRRDEHIVWVGCGQLDLLIPGSQWSHGFRTGDARTISASAVATLRGKEALGDGATTDRESFPSNLIAEAQCFSIGLSDVIGEKGAPGHGLLIPTIEVARALFGVSSRMILELVDGVRDPVVVPGRGLYDRRLSGRVSDRKVVIRAFRRLTKREAVMAALIIADAAIRRCHDLLFQQLSLTPSWANHRPTFPDVPWPFVRPTRLSFEGRWVKRTDESKRFLVTRILDIEMPLPFDEIELHHPGGVPAPGDSHPPPKVGRLAFGRTEKMNLVTGRAPSSRWRSSLLPTRDAPVQVGDEVTLRVVAHGGTAPPRTSGTGVPPETLTDFSTATPERSGAIGVRPARTERTGDGDEPPQPRTREEALDLTWQAILLAEELGADDGWEIEALPEKANGRRSAQPYDPVAGIILVEISTDAGRVIVIDCGSHGASRRSLGVLVQDDGGFLSAPAAEKLRQVAAVNGGRWRDRWGKPVAVSGYKVVAMNRGPKMWDDALIYAKAIHSTVTSVLLRAKPAPGPKP